MARFQAVCSGIAVACLLAGTASQADDRLNTLMAEGKYAKAIEYIDQSIPVPTRTVDVWIALAQAQEKTGVDKDKVTATLAEAQRVNPSDPRVYEALGDFYLHQKNYQEAIKHYQKLYLLDRSARAAQSIAICAARLKIMDKARDAAESAVKIDGTMYEARKILAEIYLAEKDFAGAARQLEALVERYKDDIGLYRKLARCYEETKSRDKLAAVDPRIIALDKKDVVSRRRMVEYSLERKDQVTAFDLLRELAILTPEDAKVFRHLYQISSDRGQKKDAVLYLKNFLAIDSSDAASFKALGDLHVSQKETDEALEAYRRALRLNPSMTGFYKPFMAMLLEKKLEDEAIAVAPRAIAANEFDAASYNALGTILKKRNRCAQAIDYFQNALKADAKNVTTLAALADCQAAVGKNADAIITYEQVVLLNPAAGVEYKALGELQMKAGKTDEAIAAFVKYVARVPGDDRISALIGLHYHQKKNCKEAIGYLEKVADAKLQTLEYSMALAECYYQTNNCPKATEHYARARTKNPPVSVQPVLLKPLAECYEKMGNQAEAAKAYEAYVKLPGVKDADAAYKQAFLREGSDRKAAMTMYDANLKTFPQDARSFVRLGILLSEDDPASLKAVGVLQSAATLTPNDPAIWQRLCGLFNKQKNSEKELGASVKLLGLEPDNLEANRRAGTILYDKKQYAQAIPYLDKVVAKAPQETESVLMLADASMKTKNASRAMELFARAKEQRGNDPQVYLALIEASEAAGQKDKAADARNGLAELDKKIVAKESKNVESRVRLADYLYSTKKDFDGANAIYRELAELTPKNKLVFERLVDISQKKGKTADAVSYLRKFVQLDSANARARLNLANLLYDQKDHDGALAEYRTAWRLDANLKGFFMRMAEIVVAKGLDDEAIRVLNAAIKNSEADVKAYITLGKLHQKKKQYPQAIAMYKKASNDDPKNIEVLTLLGECQAASGDVASAVITYEQVVMLNPQADEEHKSLGDLQMRQNKPDDAVKSYKKYLAKKSDEKIAQRVGLAEYGKKQYAEAIKYLEMVKASALITQEHLLALGDSYYNTGNCQKTIALYSQVRSQKPAVGVQKTILRPLGECYEKTNDAAKAAEAYEAYTQIPGVVDADASYLKAYLREKSDPKSAEALYLANTKAFPKDARNFTKLGMMYAASSATYGKAADMLNKASMLDPKDVATWKKLAELWKALKNDDRELAACKKLLALEPQNKEANRRVGALLIGKKQYSEAITSLEIVLATEPNDVEVMLLLSDGYLKTNRPDKGIELLAKAKTIKKDNPDLIAQLYTLYKQSGKNKEAEVEIKQLIALKKENKYRVMYAEDLIAQKRYEEAQTIATEIKKADPMNIDGLMLLGTVQSLQNKYEEAIETFKMVSYIKDNYAPAHYERGEIYRKQTTYERATTFYRKALEADSKYALAYLGLARVARAQKDDAGYQSNLAKARALDPKNSEIMAEGK